MKKVVMVLMMGAVVWGAGSSHAVTYDIVEFPVSVPSGTKAPPAISDNIVVWGDSRNGGWDIYAYDLSSQTEFAITTNQTANIAATTPPPAIDGDIVVWSDSRNAANIPNNNNHDIYGYNLSTQTEFPISTTLIPQETHVAVNGDTVAWVQWKGSDDYDIYGYDLSTQTEFPISTAPGYQYEPATNGEVVVWSDLRVGYHTGGENWDIYGYDLSTQTEFQITTAADHQEFADISGNIVVWQDDRNRYGENGTLHDIYGYDLDTQSEFAICTNDARQEQPSISDNFVVWMDDRNGDYDIYGYDLLTQTEFPIVTGAGDQMRPDISGNTVVWESAGDIYGARIITDITPVEIEWVTIGNAGNPGDARTEANPYGCGAVDYEYRIGKYEITNSQWNTFVSTVGAPTGNLSNAYDESAYYTGDQQPTNKVSWYEALQFSNYLTSGDKSKGVYQFSGDNTNPGDFLGIDRTAAKAIYGTIFFLPTEDEWHKAAYFKSDGSGYSHYANGTDTIPIAGTDNNFDGAVGQPWNVGTGTMEQNGTFDMMGNVWEWNEGLIYNIRGDAFPGHGGLSSTDRGGENPYYEWDQLGFRVAQIPEPTVIPVTIDIKPASCPNPLNTKSQGVLPLAILGTDSFDVSTIVPTSVRLAGVEPIRDSLEDVAAPLTDPNECECTTAGPDGFTDLTLKFNTQQIVEALGEVNTDDILTLSLTGVLSDETPIEGSDCVVIVGKHKSINRADINNDGLVNVFDMSIVAENWLQSSIVQ